MSTAITAIWGPTYDLQPSETPASITSRGTPGVRTLSRYSSDWAEKMFVLGMLTTLTSDTLSRQAIATLQSQMHFGTCRDQDDVGSGRRVAVGEDIAAERHTCENAGIARQIEDGKSLAGQDQSDGAFVASNGDSPCGHSFIGVRWPQDNHAGDRSQSDQLFDRLMGGAIFSHGQAVVGEDVDHRETVHRCETHRRTHVVAEDQEGSAVRDEAAV